MLSQFSRHDAKSWGKGLCLFYLMENVFERCARRFLHAEKLTSLNMSYPERSIRRLSHVKSTWAFFCNEMVEVGGDSGCSFLHCRSVRKIAK